MIFKIIHVNVDLISKADADLLINPAKILRRVTFSVFSAKYGLIVYVNHLQERFLNICCLTQLL